MSGTIHPTHTCFDDALDFIGLRLKQDKGAVSSLFLVHAICITPEGPQVGQLFAHAWVEETSSESPDGFCVWQDGFLNGQRISYAITRPELYAALKPTLLRRYTIREAWEENRRTNHFGPWEPGIQKHCRKKGT